MSTRTRRVRYADVAATVALVLAASGTAYAASLPKNSVTSKTIKNGTVKSADLKDNGVKGKDVDESSLARVPDAAALGGRPASAFKTLTMPITSAGMAGTGVSAAFDEVDLSSSSAGTVSWTLLLPDDRVASDDVTAELLYQEESPTACSWFVTTEGIVESEGGFANSAWRVPGSSANEGAVTLPAGDTSAHRARFQLASKPASGGLVTFTISRNPFNVADNCATIRLRGIKFRY